MKPVVGPFLAWFCTIVSIFGIVILSVIALLFRSGHESMMGSINDPKDGKAVASTTFSAVLVYVVFFAFCGIQVVLNKRQQSVRLR